MRPTQLRFAFTSTDPDWRELEAIEADAERHRAFDDHFGVCPYCGQSGVCLNVERDHWFVCAEHRVKWYVGSNLNAFNVTSFSNSLSSLSSSAGSAMSSAPRSSGGSGFSGGSSGGGGGGGGGGGF